MLAHEAVLPTLIFVLALSAVFRLVVWSYYRDGERILPMLKLAKRTGPVAYYKPYDTLLAPLPFLSCWLEIGGAVLLLRLTHSPLAGLLLVLVASGRMRALQEIGHNALHSALCPSKKLQWLLGNVLFQFPTIKRDMDSRYKTHVRDHHPNADVPGKDPNLARVIRAGMVPGITPLQFVLALLYPVSPQGLFNTIRGNLRDAVHENAGTSIIRLRIVTTAVVVALYLFLGGWPALLLGYLLPVFAVYPLFAWWSLLGKHRWHTTYEPSRDRRTHDYEHGRATDFPGVCGAIQRYLIFPMSDAYHLAHHIFPYVRSEYLPVIDRALKIDEPLYTQHISSGMLIGTGGQPAALSELYHRLVKPMSPLQIAAPQPVAVTTRR